MGHQNFFEYQPTKDLNRLLREYGQTCLNSNAPPAPAGNVNITWQTDSIGNISAYVPDAGAPLNPRGVWSSGTTYAVNDLVIFSGSSYISTVNGNIGNEPDSHPSDWQLIAQGGGGSNPGVATQLAFYEATGSTVSPTLMTTDATGESLFVPAVLLGQHTFSEGGYTANRNPATEGAFAGWIQNTITATVSGGGWSLGNSGGWTVNKTEEMIFHDAQRGITQLRSGTIEKHAVGDTAGLYHYVRADGGVSAQSDEGVTAATLQSLENPSYFHGTVTSVTQIGGTPTLAFTTGNNWTTDGAFLLNISKGTISGNMNGNSAALNLDIGSGATPTYLNALPVTSVAPGGALPISTAIGVATAAITPTPAVAANNPVSTVVVVNLARIGGVFQPFTIGSVVTVAGVSFPEQSILTGATTPVTVGPNQQQTLTMKLRNPNSQAIVFQGSVQGQYISFDANLALSQFRSSYFAFGSLTGTDLIYGHQVAGGVTGNTLPQLGAEAAQPTGSRSGFHLYPGAEVVANNDFGFNCTLEQNGVHWDNNNLVENPHYPTYGGTALAVIRTQFTPTNPSFGSITGSFIMEGPGTAGGTGILLKNGYAHPENYQGSGGPLAAPVGFEIQGYFSNIFSILNAPDVGAIFSVVNGPTSAGFLQPIISLSYAGGGNFFFQPDLGRWGVDGSFDSQNGFLSNHVPGVAGSFTSQDGKTVTVSGGIIIGIV